jgi:hypothetical protein
LAWLGGTFLPDPLSAAGGAGVLCATLSVPPTASAGAVSVAVLLDVAFPFPLGLSLPLVAVLSAAAVGDPPASALDEAPPVEPLSDPARLVALSVVGVAGGGGLLDSGAVVPPPVDGGGLVGLGAATGEAGGAALRVTRWRRECEPARRRAADDGRAAERITGAAEVRGAVALMEANAPVPSKTRAEGGTSLTTRTLSGPVPVPRAGHASNAITGPISRMTQTVPAIREPETATPASVSRTLRIPLRPSAAMAICFRP